MTEYTETQVPEGDTRSEVLELLCQGNPWVLVIAELDPEDESLNLKVEVGGGIGSRATVRNLLEKTLRALP